MEPATRLVKDVCRRIAELREEAEITQEEMAWRLGMATQNYRRIEIGEQNLTLRTLAKLAASIGVPVIEFFKAPAPHVVLRGRPPKRGTARATKASKSR